MHKTSLNQKQKFYGIMELPQNVKWGRTTVFWLNSICVHLRLRERRIWYMFFLYSLKGMPETSSLLKKPDDGETGNLYHCFLFHWIMPHS